MRDRALHVLAAALVALTTAPPLLAQGAATRALTIQGRVTDAAQNPVASAQVVVEGQTIGTTTADDGSYRLVIARAPSPFTLVARRIGFRPARMAVTEIEGTITRNFALARDVLELSQVVTTATRTETERAQLGATLATVSGEALSNAVTPQLDVALSGKVAGALVTQNSGTPGGGTSVRIRGLSTISRSAEPLYIVDGVIIDNGSRQLVDLGGYTTNRLADLDPNDIERVEVVKGAAAAALYGSRANDGVVQIFTRRGRSGALKGTARVMLGQDKVTRFLPVNAAPTNLAGTPVTRYDYQNDIFQHGRQANANVSFAGGDDRTQFYLSGSHEDQTGVIRSTRYVRDNVRLNLDRTLADWLRLGVSSSFIQSNADLTPNGGLVANYGVLTNFLFSSNDRNFYPDPVTGAYPAAQFQANPLDVIANWKAPQGVQRYIGGLHLTATPVQGLTADYRFGYDGFTETADQFIPRGATAVAYPTGLAVSAANRARLVNSDLDVSYTAQPTPWVKLTPSVGMNWQQQRFDQTIAQAQDLALFTQTVQGSTQFASQVRDDRRTLGFYGQLQAGLHDLLFLTAALRSDASSAFGSDQRTQYFPKFGASLDVSGMEWWRSTVGTRVNRLRLRAAIGESGGQPAGSFDRFSNYVFEPAGTASGIANSTRQGNEGLKPERQKELELGADAEFLDGRAGIEATYYDKTVTDLVLPRTVLPSTGFLDQLANVGELRNKGLELLARAVPVQRTGVAWTVTGTVTTSDPKVTKLSSGGAFFIPGSFNIVRVATDPGDGSAPGHFYGTTYVRNAQGQILGFIAATSTTARQDSVPIIDASGNVVAVPYIGPRKVIGNPNAHAFWSVSNELTLGTRWSLRAQVDGVSGVDIFNFDRRLLETPAFGTGAAYAAEILKQVPSGYFQARRSIFQEYVENGAYAKLREISVSYQLDPRWLRMRGVTGATLTVAGRNLKTWTDYSGWDPETNAGAQSTLVRGFAFATTPIPRTVTVAAALTF
ncbi:MAG: TonB-dependent receptor [Gemmatimonadaceae bacterium]|nr:TonB-dependent receptor [Gemmatimonadaceae bacterium]